MMPLADITPDICGLSQSLIDRILTLVDAYPTVERALFYGSKAKGSDRLGSDIGRSRLAAIQNESLPEHIRRRGRVFCQR